MAWSAEINIKSVNRAFCDTEPSESSTFVMIMYHLVHTLKSYEFNNLFYSITIYNTYKRDSDSLYYHDLINNINLIAFSKHFDWVVEYARITAHVFVIKSH
jgi:hypothetical protein